MDLGYFLGGLIVPIAPPIISVIARKLRKKPSLKNPFLQYIITFFIIIAILATGGHEYLGLIVVTSIIIYAFCFYIDYSMYRQNEKNHQIVAKDELKYLDFEDNEAVMRFAQKHPESVDEVQKLLELHEKLKR